MIYRKKNRRKTSYSQSGEDMIISYLFESQKIEHPSYLDIGAHDPFLFSNTAFFYKTGSRGVNIDANPICINKFQKCRKHDVNLNYGVGEEGGQSLSFYVMNPPTMSTFSKEAAEELVSRGGMSINSVIDVEMISVSSVLEKYCNGVFPDFLTLDAEGLDYSILKSIDYTVTFPKVICVETKSYWSKNVEAQEDKDTKIIDFLKSKDYVVFADTGINTIFCHRDLT